MTVTCFYCKNGQGITDSHDACRDFADSRRANGKCEACGVNDLAGENSGFVDGFWCTVCGPSGRHAKYVGYPNSQ